MTRAYTQAYTFTFKKVPYVPFSLYQPGKYNGHFNIPLIFDLSLFRIYILLNSYFQVPYLIHMYLWASTALC